MSEQSEDTRSLEMNSAPLVSILVPSYNHEKFILECLESVKNLRYPRLELLVSDDCSRDQTFLLAQQWALKNSGRFERISITRQDTNTGLVGNLQSLFDGARGDYLAYIASDDVFIESAIARRVEMFLNDRSIDGIFANAQSISIDGKLLKEAVLSKHITAFYSKMCTTKLFVSAVTLYGVAPGPTMMLRRDASLDSGSLGRLPTTLRAEDAYIYLRLAARGRLRFVNEVVAKWREVPGSMGRSGVTSTFNVETQIDSGGLIKHQLSGFNRFVMDTKIARNLLELDKRNALRYRVRVFLKRCILAQLKAILCARALFLKVRSASLERASE